MVGCQARLFSNPNKLSNTEFFNRELKENPEFFKAFPHLQEMFDESRFEYQDLNGEMAKGKKYVEDKMVNFSGLTKDEPYFKSLLNQYTDTMMSP